MYQCVLTHELCAPLCVYPCVCLCILMSLCVFMYLCAYVCPCVCLCTPLLSYTYMLCMILCVPVLCTYVSVCAPVCSVVSVASVHVCTYVPVCIFVCTHMHVQLCIHACMCLGVRTLPGAPDTWACAHANVHEWGWGTGGKTIFLEALLDRLPSYLYCHVNQIFSGSPPRSLGALSPPGCEPQTRLPNR